MHLTSNGSQISDLNSLSWPPLEEVYSAGNSLPCFLSVLLLCGGECTGCHTHCFLSVLLSCGGECTGCHTHFSFFVVCKTWGRVSSMFSHIHFPKESGLLDVFSPCVLFTSQRRVVYSSVSHHQWWAAMMENLSVKAMQ